MTTDNEARVRSWYLAFDSGCSTCSDVARRVRGIVGDRLEVVGLLDPEIQELRARAFSDEPPWAPTLLRLDEASRAVRAWTGLGLVVLLVRHLGLRRTIGIVRSLQGLAAQVPDLERRRMLKLAPGGILGLLTFAGLGATGTALASRAGNANAPSVERTRHLGDSAVATRAVQATLVDIGRETIGSSALKQSDFAWQHSELIEYADGGTSVIVPAKPALQTNLERVFLLASYDGDTRQSDGVLLQRFKRQDFEAAHTYTVDFETLDQEPIVGFEVDEREQRMRKVIHAAGHRSDEPVVLAAPTEPLAYHNYWHCVQRCLADAWDTLPWWLRAACTISCGGCIFAGNIFACATCVGCLGGYAYGCTVTIC